MHTTNDLIILAGQGGHVRTTDGPSNTNNNNNGPSTLTHVHVHTTSVHDLLSNPITLVVKVGTCTQLMALPTQ
jgi:hypothetical protein